MQFALLIYESPEGFAARNSDGTDPYTRRLARHTTRPWSRLVFTSAAIPCKYQRRGPRFGLGKESGVYRMAPFADTKEQLGGFTILELPSLDAALDWAARCPAASLGAVEVRPLAPDMKRRITG